MNSVKMREAGSKLGGEEEVEDLNAATAVVFKKQAERSAEISRLQSELKSVFVGLLTTTRH